jgi:hypothetical protein
MKNSDISLSSLIKSFGSLGKTFSKYAFLFFLLFLAAVYGFVLYRINVYVNVEPSDSVAAQARSSTPHIDQSVVTQLQNLNDNSVSVKTLFEDARSNPFQE